MFRIYINKLYHYILLGNHCYDLCSHTLSIAFWHLPPDSARFSYATEGVLCISSQSQLSTDAVSTLQKVWVLIRP